MADLNTSWARARKLLAGEASLSDLRADITARYPAALNARAADFCSRLAVQAGVQPEERLKAAIRLAADDNGAVLPFAEFERRINDELVGIVFTAHPTFALNQQAQEFLLELLSGGAPNLSELAELHRTQSPTLEEEMREAGRALRHVRSAIRQIYNLTLEVAEEIYPSDWHTLVPRFVTAATWVGFDLDGRTDIGWVKSQEFRYKLALDGLEALKSSVAGLPAGDTAKPSVDALVRGLEDFETCFQSGLALLGEIGSDVSEFAKLNRLALKNKAVKESAMSAINAGLDALLSLDLGAADQRALLVFRAEWQAFGLGLGHIHFRVNAAQLHNAIRGEIGLAGEPDQSASRRHFLRAVTELLDGVEAGANVHYGTVAQELTTARRVFMLAAQFEKHFDGQTPIRMLVAESDTSFTVLAALYYARLFGVDDHVEISPLFETDIGLQRGDRVIDELLDNPHFCRYVREQGRFCVQLGYSDSGRYIGQIAASLAIERFKLRLVKLWAARGMGDVQLVFFDTHGESIGRGTHPGTLRDRYLTTHTPAVRRALLALDAPYKQEVSFQGGDGYLWFASEDMAFQVITELLMVRVSTRPNAPEDPIYSESAWALDFFLTMRQRQDDMADHKGYVALIDSIGRNLLYPTGSRASKRQGRGKHAPGLESISQLRAIPNNATLHQLGYLANTLYGIGDAIGLSGETFARLSQDSSRLRRLMRLASGALKRSSIRSAFGYLQVMRPGEWLEIAESESDPVLRRHMSRLTVMLEERFDQPGMARLVRDWQRDAIRRDDLAKAHGLDLVAEPDPALEELHSMRLALIQFIYMKAMAVPQFSTRLDLSLDDVRDELLHLDVPEALEQLRTIFPAATDKLDDEVYGETATYRGEKGGYRDLHGNIFDAIEDAYSLIHALSALIALKVGAFG